MEPINNHRRRKNSLMSPIANNGAGPSSQQSSRPRAQSLRSPQSDDPRISEEPTSFDGSALPKDDQARDDSSDDDLHDDEETGLTRGEKKKRQQRRRRNTLLDQRIARDKSVSPDERKEADKSVVKRLLINCLLILLWYLFSLSISLVSGLLLPGVRSLRVRVCADTLLVQQMDVRQEAPQLCLPPIHNLNAHARAIRSLRPSSSPCPLATAELPTWLRPGPVEA
jgi:hypothetical protein